jgi:GDP-L-fucose synthase
MRRDESIFVAGHRGLVGSAVVRALAAAGHTAIVTRTRAELDLTRQEAVEQFFAAERPAHVVVAAARVGGILANHTFPADFIRDNLQIQANVIDAAYRHGAAKLLFLGSSCVYPRLAPQPIKEEHLLTGPLEPTNRAYAVAKIAGLEMVDAYRRQYGFRGVSLMPTNLYGPGDDFDPRTAHVLPALMRRFHEAKVAGAPEVVVWGTGQPMRELLHVDDLADACLFVLREYDDAGLLNVGAGHEVSVRDLAELLKEIVGFRGAVRFDPTQPDGTPRKLLDTSRLRALGWQAKTPLRRGIEETYAWFLNQR